MASGKHTIKDGPVKLTVDQRRLIDLMDRLYDGAASSFIEQVHDHLDPIVAAARQRWPVRSGAGRDSLLTETRVGETLKVLAGTSLPGKRLYYQRWSVRTKSEMDAEARRVADAVTSRGRVPGLMGDGSRRDAHSSRASHTRPGEHDRVGRAAYYAAKRTRSIRGMGAWEAARSYHRRYLTAVHGEGAPDTKSAGKQAWSLYILRPDKKCRKDLINKLRADVDKLAGGG